MPTDSRDAQSEPQVDLFAGRGRSVDGKAGPRVWNSHLEKHLDTDPAYALRTIRRIAEEFDRSNCSDGPTVEAIRKAVAAWATDPSRRELVLGILGPHYQDGGTGPGLTTLTQKSVLWIVGTDFSAL